MNTLLSAGIDIYPGERKQMKKVLIVEDDRVWQILIGRAIELIDKRIQPIFATNVAQALNLISTEPQIGCVISDLFLNGSSSGLDLWNTMRADGIDVPYVLISASEPKPTGDSPLRVAHPMFIEKQATVDKLSMKLRHCLAIQGGD